MEWADLWTWYRNVDYEFKQSILEQINLKNLLSDLSPKHQIIVLAEAPHSIVKSALSLLHPKTKKYLGYVDKPKKKKMTTKQLLARFK